ncbi:MAG TPA: response regulator transcription factor [Candidatus Sulfotelmatobacter sp.]|jgi:DNA-binding NarL/FixJ family response regulator
MPAKILIVDDHEVVREGIRTLITRARPQWEICGEASNAREAIELCRSLKPDVTVLDITMPGMSGLEAASMICAFGSRVLMFTMHESEHLAIEVAQAGAQGFVLKSQAGKDLIRAIERLLGGGTFFGSESNPQQSAPGLPPSGTLGGRSSEVAVGFLRALVAVSV